MRVAHAVMLICVLIPVVSIGTYILYLNYKVDYVRSIEAEIMVSRHWGVNIDKDKLYLGSVRPGGEAYRNFTVTNTDQFEREIRIYTGGVMKEWARVNDQKFRLGPNETKHITFYLAVPKETAYGNYTSPIYVFFMKR